MNQTIDSVALYVQRYANHRALIGFYLLNEPAHLEIDILQDYYKRAYAKVREFSNEIYVILNPLIGPFETGTEDYWINFMNPDQGYSKVVLDLHYYFCFGGPSDKNSADDAIKYAKTDLKEQIMDFKAKNSKLMMVGEWSACGHFDVNRAGDFAQTQANVFDSTSFGWTYWSWTDGQLNNVWSLKTAFKQTWIKPLTPC